MMTRLDAERDAMPKKRYKVYVDWAIAWETDARNEQEAKDNFMDWVEKEIEVECQEEEE